MPAFRQSLRLHRPLIAARPALLEVVRIVRSAWISSIAPLVGTLSGDFGARGLGRRPEMAIVDETQKPAARGSPLPDVGVAAVHGVVQPASGEGRWLAINRRAAGVKGAITGEQWSILGEQNRELVLVILTLVAAVVVGLQHVPAIGPLGQRKVLE